MNVTSAGELICDAVLTLAYPQTCVICGESVEQRRFGVACESCWKEARIFTDAEAICWKCGLSAPAEVAVEFRDQVRCRSCDDMAFTAARAVGTYEGALRESVLLLKRRPCVPQYVKSLLAATVRREPLRSSTRVVPVPLHPKRLKTRGFNQASIVAEAVSKALKLPLDEVSLVRVSSTEKYRAGLDRKGRRDTVAGAFAVSHSRLVAGENILLVDDVFTTGGHRLRVRGCSHVRWSNKCLYIDSRASVIAGVALRGHPCNPKYRNIILTPSSALA
jgi:predicted amidophosphoribosyltransferase